MKNEKNSGNEKRRKQTRFNEKSSERMIGK